MRQCQIAPDGTFTRPWPCPACVTIGLVDCPQCRYRRYCDPDCSVCGGSAVLDCPLCVGHGKPPAAIPHVASLVLDRTTSTMGVIGAVLTAPREAITNCPITGRGSALLSVAWLWPLDGTRYWCTLTSSLAAMV